MNVYFANGYVLSREFEDGRARIRATEIDRRARAKLKDGQFTAMALDLCKQIVGHSMRKLQPDLTGPIDPTDATGPTGFHPGGVWLTEPQAYAVITGEPGRLFDVLLRQVIQAFVDLRDARVRSVLGEPVTPEYKPKKGCSLSEFETLYYHCVAPISDLEPDMLRSEMIDLVVEIFDERRRALGVGMGPVHLA
jgi:hypothetical protein